MSKQVYFDPYSNINNPFIELKEVVLTAGDTLDLSDYTLWCKLVNSFGISISDVNLSNINILIPYHNSNVINKTLENILYNQILPIEVSITITIVASACDDMHLTMLRDILAKINKPNSKISLIIQPVPGKPLALNTGIKNINSTHIIQLVDDVLLSNNAIALMWLGLICAKDYGAAVLVGKPSNLDKPGLLYEVQKIHHALFYKNDQFALIGRCFAFRKDFIAKMGGFPENIMSEDFWLEMHVREFTKGFVIVNRAFLLYEKPNTWHDYLKQIDRFDGSFRQLKREYSTLFLKHYGFIHNSISSMLGISTERGIVSFFKLPFTFLAKITYVLVVIYQTKYLGIKNSLFKVNSAKFTREISTIDSSN